jgi:hypothetical protein
MGEGICAQADQHDGQAAGHGRALLLPAGAGGSRRRLVVSLAPRAPACYAPTFSSSAASLARASPRCISRLCRSAAAALAAPRRPSTSASSDLAAPCALPSLWLSSETCGRGAGGGRSFCRCPPSPAGARSGRLGRTPPRSGHLGRTQPLRQAAPQRLGDPPPYLCVQRVLGLPQLAVVCVQLSGPRR